MALSLRRLLRHPRIARHYPARFRTTQDQDLPAVLREWLRDQLDDEGRRFDRLHGISTSLFDLGNYEPTPPSVVQAVLEAIPPPHERLAFVDLGSGKGRVVLMAAQHPFRRVIGIERRRALHWRAVRNERSFRGALHTQPEWIRADVQHAGLPDGPAVLFTYNPFGPRVLDELLASIREEVMVASVNPLPKQWFEERGFELVIWKEDASDDRRWAIFTRPASPAARPPLPPAH